MINFWNGILSLQSYPGPSVHRGCKELPGCHNSSIEVLLGHPCHPQGRHSTAVLMKQREKDWAAQGCAEEPAAKRGTKDGPKFVFGVRWETWDGHSTFHAPYTRCSWLEQCIHADSTEFHSLALLEIHECPGPCGSFREAWKKPQHEHKEKSW